MDENVQITCLILLAALLCVAVVSDVRHRIIPNWLTGAVAVLVIPYWLAIGLAPWPDMAIQIALALATLAIFAALFAFGLMGGGDVKLLAALALWLPLTRFVELIVIMSLVGGVLTLGMLVRHRIERRIGQPEIPYGVAIAVAAIWAFSEPFINQFGA